MQKFLMQRTITLPLLLIMSKALLPSEPNRPRGTSQSKKYVMRLNEGKKSDDHFDFILFLSNVLRIVSLVCYFKNRCLFGQLHLSQLEYSFFFFTHTQLQPIFVKLGNTSLKSPKNCFQAQPNTILLPHKYGILDGKLITCFCNVGLLPVCCYTMCLLELDAKFGLNIFNFSEFKYTYSVCSCLFKASI